MVCRFFLAVALSIMWLTVSAQTAETTPNLVTSGANHSWNGVVTNSTHSPGAGPLPVYVPSANYIVFGYNQQTVNQVIGINTALAHSGSGIQVSGVRYSWNYFNTGSNRGILSAQVDITTNTGNSLYSYNHNMPATNNGWVNFNQVQSFGSLRDVKTLGNATVSFTGVDYRNATSQDRYYGPAVQHVNLRFDYTVAPVDPCVSDPLYSPDCAGYAQAYIGQQCLHNPLYSNQCPGYAQAYFAQQCDQNTLYNSACPGYATAYYNYMCSANALYHTGCSGYAAAYFDQQCSLDPLHNQKCPGYADAYFVQQCTADSLYNSGCAGYAQAYFDQQCLLDTLYNSQCPGYETAYFNQQCANDALYNNQCPGYSTAYAKKYILVAAPTTTVAAGSPVETVGHAQPITVETTEVATATVTTETAPASAVAATAATAPVLLAAAPAPAASTASAEKKTENKDSTANTTAAGGASESKSRPVTTRQALAQRRLTAARAAAAQSAKNNPAAVSEQMDSAASMEQQVELQNVVMGAMGFVAGFDAYRRVNLQDAVGYKPFEIYSGQINVDTPAARDLLGRSDKKHQDMVDSQYKK